MTESEKQRIAKLIAPSFGWSYSKGPDLDYRWVRYQNQVHEETDDIASKVFQELAEFIAGVRGWAEQQYQNHSIDKWGRYRIVENLQAEILHDSQFLSLVREMEDKNLYLCIIDRELFLMDGEAWPRSEKYSLQDHGHMIALCLAVRDALKEEV